MVCHRGKVQRPVDTHWPPFGVALDGQVLLNASKQPKFFDVPWYLILNTALGGGWPGSVTNETAFPITHEIDYVRVARPRTTRKQ